MPGVKCWQIDAFTDRPFGGNPAAVCWLEQDAPGAWMQSVAAEMNLPATAFVRRLGDGYELRWFTAAVELELCGHGTLAATHTLWEAGIADTAEPLTFHTRGGVLTCTRSGGVIELDFPALPASAALPHEGLLEALGVEAPHFVGRTKLDFLVAFDSPEKVRSLRPDFHKLTGVPTRGVIVTAPSDDRRYDFISRFFAPAVGIDEDPVTGSAHCCLTPYWAGRLGKRELSAYQASARGGVLRLRSNGDRVALGGQAVMVWQGELVGPTRPSGRDTGPAIDLTCRPATADDVPLLARMNKELIEDEGSRNPMSVAELEERMRGWLEGDWRAALFEQDGSPVGYALFQSRSDEYGPADTTVYVRQFFVGRGHRSRGVGRRAFEAVARTCFPAVPSVVLDVLETNLGARRFWESLGFRPYCTTMKLTRGGPAGD